MPSTTGMKGDGFYDVNSSGQRAAIETIAPWIESAAASLAPPPTGQPIVIADFGCSEGRNSILSTGLAIETLRAQNIVNPITAIFSDLPTNDFNQLFRNLTAAQQNGAAGVFPAAVGGSFFTQILPAASVHLAMSFTAVLWLDHLPEEPLREFCVFLSSRSHRPDVVISTATAVAFQRQAHSDLERFYTCRAAEILPGGRLLVVQPGATSDHVTGEGLYDLLHDACLSLIRDGRLNRSAYERVTMPIYFRTLEELLAPIESRAGELSKQFAIERAETQSVTMPFAEAFARSGDLATYVDRYVGFAQAFTEPVLRAALDPTEGPDVVPEVYERMKQLLRAMPAQYEIRYLQVAALLARR